MRIALVALLFALALAGSGAAAKTSTCTVCGIEITPAGFHSLTPDNPAVGAKVEWTNSDTKNHQVSHVGGVFRSEILKPFSFYERRVSAGKWQYRDPVGNAPSSYFIVAPELQAKGDAVVARWATPVTDTGRHFCVQWSVERRGVTFTYIKSPRIATTANGGRLRRGKRFVDNHGTKITLRRGDQVRVALLSGIGSKCPNGETPEHPLGWSQYTSSVRVKMP